jgi:glycosyltransferase involved in cell wall biosynthesis
LRVLNVNATLDPVSGGGTAERTFQLSRSMAKAGAECAVLTLEAGLSPERVGTLGGAQVVALPVLWGRHHVPRVSRAAVEEARAAVEGSDVVHLMNHWTLLNAVVYLLARRAEKPYVVCPAGALPIYGRSKYLKRAYNRLVGYGIIRNAAGHVAITADEIPQFEAYGVKAGRVSVIPNGIDPSDYRAKDDADFRRRHDLGDGPFILFVGRLNRIKGPDLLVEAFALAKDELPGHLLVLAGPDEGMLPELQKTAAGSGVGDRVRFVGYLGGEEKSRAYHAADLLVVPSRQEAMSIVALEAGICGTPVLLTDRCGFDEVESADGGQVVPASVEGLRAGLVELLRDPVGLARMGENLRRLAQDRYSWDSAIEKYFELYEHILGVRARPR